MCLETLGFIENYWNQLKPVEYTGTLMAGSPPKYTDTLSGTDIGCEFFHQPAIGKNCVEVFGQSGMVVVKHPGAISSRQAAIAAEK